MLLVLCTRKHWLSSSRCLQAEEAEGSERDVVQLNKPDFEKICSDIESGELEGSCAVQALQQAACAVNDEREMLRQQLADTLAGKIPSVQGLNKGISDKATDGDDGKERIAALEAELARLRDSFAEAEKELARADGLNKGLEDEVAQQAELKNQLAGNDGAADKRNAELEAELAKLRDALSGAEKELGRAERVPAAGSTVRPRPPGMALPVGVTLEMKAMQWKEPQKWSLTMRQFCTVVEHCMTLPEYVALKKQKRFVTMYDLCNIYVKSWSAGTGKCCEMLVPCNSMTG